MFSCGCSLRSTQCAALIALATAAGISRFEAPRAEQASTSDAERPAAIEAVALTERVLTFYRVLDQVAPWLVQFWNLPSRVDPTPGALRQGNGGNELSSQPAFVGAIVLDCNVRACVSSLEVAHSETCLLKPSARQHAFPYAVGPPWDESAQNEREVGTCVPGEFAPCSRMVENFATVDIAVVALSRISRERESGEAIRGSLAEFGPVRVNRNLAQSLFSNFERQKEDRRHEA